MGISKGTLSCHHVTPRYEGRKKRKKCGAIKILLRYSNLNWRPVGLQRRITPVTFFELLDNQVAVTFM